VRTETVIYLLVLSVLVISHRFASYEAWLPLHG